MMELTELRAVRLARNGIYNNFKSVGECASSLAGIQCQLQSAAEVSFINRVSNCTSKDVRDAHLETKQIIKQWGQRGTLHWYGANDWSILYSAFQDFESWMFRKLKTIGYSKLAYLRILSKIASLCEKQPYISDIDLHSLGINVSTFCGWGGFYIDLCRRFPICYSSLSGSGRRFSHRNVWLPALKWQQTSSRLAWRQLIVRYISSFGPISVRDIKFWSGLSTSLINDLIDEVPNIETLSVKGLDYPLLQLEPLTQLIRHTPIFLYRFDPLLLSYHDKEWIVPRAFQPQVWRKAGHVEGVIVEEGEAIGTWRYRRLKKTDVHITVTPFRSKPSSLQRYGLLAEGLMAQCGFRLTKLEMAR